MYALDLATMNRCVNILGEQLARKKESLRRAEFSIGTGHSLRKMNRLRKEISSLEARLSMAEKLQEEALISKPPPSLPHTSFKRSGESSRPLPVNVAGRGFESEGSR